MTAREPVGAFSRFARRHALVVAIAFCVFLAAVIDSPFRITSFLIDGSLGGLALWFLWLRLREEAR